MSWMFVLGLGGMAPNFSLADASLLSERLLAERLQAERLNERLMLPTDPIYRLEMAGLGTGASVTEQSHTTHTHSHTHLHLHQPDAAAAAAVSLYPPFHPLVASTPHLFSAPGFPLPGETSFISRRWFEDKERGERHLQYIPV